MKKAKTSAVLLLSALAVGTLVGCNTKPQDITVDFKVLNSDNAWTVLKTETVVDGKVTVPEAPVKNYYDFGGWFKEETFATAFVDTGITESCAAYGKYIAQEVTVYLNGENVGTKNLVDVANATYNPGEGLVFSGWYKDAALQVKWNGVDTVSELYASNLAMVTFNNGYEDVYTTLVKPGTVVTNPAKTEYKAFDGSVSTLEKEEIIEFYMDERDINYVDSEGKAFDFTKPMNKSTVVTVNWSTKGLQDFVRYDEAKDVYYYEYVKAQQTDPYPAISFQGVATIPVDNDDAEKGTKTVNVSSYYSYSKILSNVTKKIIFGEGIKSIAGLNGEEANNVEEVSLPSTLKILDNCFNNCTKLKGVKLPEGLEILIGSFFKRTNAMDLYKSFEYGTQHDFEILVPASVKNLALTPTNLRFAEGSKFFKEDGRIYTKKGEDKILISDAENLTKSTIVVPDGVVGIQTGTYHTKFDYLVLPESFKYVSYNEDISAYPYYKFMEGSSYSISANHLYDKANAGTGSEGLVTSAMSPTSYSISDNLGGYNMMGQVISSRGTVIFKSEAVPETLNAYAFVGDSMGWSILTGGFQPMTTEALKANIVLKDNADKLYVTIRVENEYAGYQNFSATVDAQKVTDVNALVEIIKLANPEQVDAIDAAIKDKTLVITSNNEEIQASAINGEMFVTILVK